MVPVAPWSLVADDNYHPRPSDYNPQPMDPLVGTVMVVTYLAMVLGIVIYVRRNRK